MAALEIAIIPKQEPLMIIVKYAWLREKFLAAKKPRHSNQRDAAIEEGSLRAISFAPNILTLNDCNQWVSTGLSERYSPKRVTDK